MKVKGVHDPAMQGAAENQIPFPQPNGTTRQRFRCSRSKALFAHTALHWVSPHLPESSAFPFPHWPTRTLAALFLSVVVIHDAVSFETSTRCRSRVKDPEVSTLFRNFSLSFGASQVVIFSPFASSILFCFRRYILDFNSFYSLAPAKSRCYSRERKWKV